jgi:hypothetical protein
LLYMFQMGILREFPYICLIAEFLRTCVFWCFQFRRNLYILVPTLILFFC